MQRSIATGLTLLLGWLLIASALVSGESTLPACCRKAGKHHCVMTHGTRAEDSVPTATNITAKCPCCPLFTAASQVQFCAPAIGQAIFAGAIRHPAVSPQTESNYRISHDRSRQKRGPPFLILT
jgi:hypothetical protein